MRIADLLKIGYTKRIVSGAHMLLKPLNNGHYVAIMIDEPTEFPVDGDDVTVSLLEGAEEGIGDLISEYRTNMKLLEEALAVELDDGTIVYDPFDESGNMLVSRYDLQDSVYCWYSEED